MTVLDTLKAVNAYPVQHSTLTSICARRGVDPDVEATQEILLGTAYRLARADLLLWFAAAPNVSQGGQSFSFSEYERKQLRAEGLAIIEELEDEKTKHLYGYKGSRL